MSAQIVQQEKLGSDRYQQGKLDDRHFGGGGGGGSDEFFDSVVLLMHFDGTDGAAVYNDVIGHTVTGHIDDPGSPLLNTSQKMFGASSLYCGLAGTSTGYLDTAEFAEFGFGTNDFTVELWVYPTDASTGLQQILQTRNASQQRFAFYIDSNSLVVANPSTQLRVVAGGLASNSWQHLAYARAGTTGKLFVNGIQLGADATDNANYPTAGVAMSLRPDAPAFSHFRGYMDDIRITNGVARYTANFTPPDAAFPDQGP